MPDALGTIYVGPAGPRSARLIFLGQSPGEQEEEDGLPFVGPAGQLLQDVCADVGLNWKRIYRTNVFKHRLYLSEPEDVKDLIGATRRPRAIMDELALVVSARLIVAFGNEALYTLLFEWGIKKFRGRVVKTTKRQHPAGGRPVLPALHPAYFLRGNMHELGLLVEDLKLAHQIAYGGKE